MSETTLGFGEASLRLAEGKGSAPALRAVKSPL
jgi:hypothetical protein